MALLETDHGYTHKKFNYGYSHKKLRLRVRQRVQENNENINPAKLEQVKTGDCSNKNLFRPYALDENNTPRKRKISTSPASLEENNIPAVDTTQTSQDVNNLLHQTQQQTALNIITTTANNWPTSTSSTYSSDFSNLSPNSYNIRLQRQRAAIYMHYMAQIQQQNAAAMLQTATGYPMGYPNVTAPIFNGC